MSGDVISLDVVHIENEIYLRTYQTQPTRDLVWIYITGILNLVVLK